MAEPVAEALGRSVLELAAVQPRTMSDYLRRLLCVRGFVGSECLDDASDLDETVVQWFDLLFKRGHSSADGAKFLAALQHLWP